MQINEKTWVERCGNQLMKINSNQNIIAKEERIFIEIGFKRFVLERHQHVIFVYLEQDILS